jgi:hypothetical protein
MDVPKVNMVDTNMYRIERLIVRQTSTEAEEPIYSWAWRRRFEGLTVKMRSGQKSNFLAVDLLSFGILSPV